MPLVRARTLLPQRASGPFLGPLTSADHRRPSDDDPLEVWFGVEEADDASGYEREAEHFRGVPVPIAVGNERGEKLENLLNYCFDLFLLVMLS